MQRIIGFCGRIGSGKSTAARYLCEHHGFERISFAAPLKDMFASYLRLRGASEELISWMIAGDLKEKPSPLLGGRTPRHAMQTLGDWGRALHEDFWVDAWQAAIAGKPRVAVDDVRFPNEAARIRALGGWVIRVGGRQGQTGGNCHASEAHDLDIDCEIDNSRSMALVTLDLDKVVLSKESAKKRFLANHIGNLQ